MTQFNKDCCYLCDTYITQNSGDKRLGMKQYELQTLLISAVKKCLPSIKQCQFDLICQSCLNYMTHFDNVRTKWEANECIIERKRLLGQFKGLQDIVQPKKASIHICRLCFKETGTQEVKFIYHDDQIYQTGYVHKMLSSHSPRTNLSLTENPIICTECLDAIQTFDAFYQMWLHAQSTKSQYLGQIVNTRSDKVESSGNILPLPFRKPVEMSTLTETEIAIRGLANVRNSHADKSEELIDAMTIKSFPNLTQSQFPQNEDKMNEDDIYLISDDEEVEKELDSTQNKRKLNTEKEIVKVLPLNENICYYPEQCNEKHIDRTEINLDDRPFYENKSDCTVSFSEEIVENSKAVRSKSNMSMLKKPMEFNNQRLGTQNAGETVECSNKKMDSVEDTILIEDNEIFHSKIPTLEMNMTGLCDSIQLMNGTFVEAGQFTFVEVDDSDSVNSDDLEVINAPLLPKIVNVTSINKIENEATMAEINMPERKQLLQRKEKAEDEINYRQDAGHSILNNEGSIAAEIAPRIEINMSRVKELFQTNTGDTNEVFEVDSDEIKQSLKEDVIPSEVGSSKINEILKHPNINTTTKENNLEQNLSDYLQFKNPTKTSQHDIQKPDELLHFKNCQSELKERLGNGPEVKKKKVESVTSTISEKNYPLCPRKEYTYLSAYEEFMLKNRMPSQSLCPLKKGRKYVAKIISPVHQSLSERKIEPLKEMPSETVVLDDDGDDCLKDDYCKWFPFKKKFLDRCGDKKYKKVNATVFETRSGSRLYRCCMCLLVVTDAFDILSHNCGLLNVKRRFSCEEKSCLFTTHNEIHLRNHKLLHKLDESSWHKCNLCEFRASEVNLIQDHQKESHQTGIVRRHPKCPHCFFESDIPEILSHHISACISGQTTNERRTASCL